MPIRLKRLTREGEWAWEPRIPLANAELLKPRPTNARAKMRKIEKRISLEYTWFS